MYLYLPLLNVYTSISWVKKLDDPVRKELEFLKGSESKPVPLFKNEKTS